MCLANVDFKDKMWQSETIEMHTKVRMNKWKTTNKYKCPKTQVLDCSLAVKHLPSCWKPQVQSLILPEIGKKKKKKASP